MKKRIIVNRHNVQHNRRIPEHKCDESPCSLVRPPITVTTHKGSTTAFEVKVLGPGIFRYTPDKPLKCGATIYFETDAEVQIIDTGEVL